ncbi:hypothetical protein MIZ03_0635 [Rhodoferax lithotrophicus]|uniref:Uncharacterized protein n=1 Tax=Rhodoferax lithotrophicus TaxID=2798804 RepID=A0ABM7MHQ5_9BURK|nr:hypothetical protein MIZ03_0635 [Rhodoferax sp. MIZ03]
MLSCLELFSAGVKSAVFSGQKARKKSLDLGVFPWNHAGFSAFKNIGKQIAMLSS